MLIGINATAAIKQPRTGVEEYCYQVIKHLTMLPESREHRFFLYMPKAIPIRGWHTDGTDNSPHPSLNIREGAPPLILRGGWEELKVNASNPFDFPLPENFEIKELAWPLPMWTQIRLASEMLFHKPDVLFIPVHILPQIHPKNSVVTIHGLEYEYFPEYYPFWFRNYLRWSTRYAVKNARKIIAVSENTKGDLIKLYRAEVRKIYVIHHGIDFSIQNSKFKIQNYNNSPHPPLYKRGGAPFLILREGWGELNRPYLLYIGRIELKKNILGILNSYQILKEKYKIPHELVLVGPPGYGYDEIQFKIKTLRLRSGYNVRELGYVSEDEKWQLLANADIFLFPSFYEGFGIPILEAQAASVPVISSNVSSVPEVVRNSAILVDPKDPEEIAHTTYKIIDDFALRDKLIELGYENAKRFSWERCARKTLSVLLS